MPKPKYFKKKRLNIYLTKINTNLFQQTLYEDRIIENKKYRCRIHNKIARDPKHPLTFPLQRRYIKHVKDMQNNKQEIRKVLNFDEAFNKWD